MFYPALPLHTTSALRMFYSSRNEGKRKFPLPNPSPALKVEPALKNLAVERSRLGYHLLSDTPADCKRSGGHGKVSSNRERPFTFFCGGGGTDVSTVSIFEQKVQTQKTLVAGIEKKTYNSIKAIACHTS